MKRQRWDPLDKCREEIDLISVKNHHLCFCLHCRRRRRNHRRRRVLLLC